MISFIVDINLVYTDTNRIVFDINPMNIDIKLLDADVNSIYYVINRLAANFNLKWSLRNSCSPGYILRASVITKIVFLKLP